MIGSAARWLRRSWRLARVALAALVVWALAAGMEGHLARVQWAALPDVDYLAEARHLRAAERYGEALMVADEGLRDVGGPGRAALERERAAIIAERDAVLRRLREVGLGAISGQGDSLESLLGAVAADLFVVGDVRDLAIQGGRYVLDGETDGVILLLSGVGLATTVVPPADWAPSVLKVARKTGAMTRGLAEQIVRLVRTGRLEDLKRMLGDVRVLAERASPGGAVRLLRHAENADDVAALARFVERQPAGAFALHVTGAEGAMLVKRLGPAADEAVVLAARKGPHGVAWLRAGGHRALLRPHPLVGLAKGLWKGNVQEAVARGLERIGPHLWWALPLAASWLFLEGAMLLRSWLVRSAPESARSARRGVGVPV